MKSYYAKNDYLIEELIEDDTIIIRYDGKIYRNNDKGKFLLVHRIIYRRFNGQGSLQADLVVNHKDGNSLNNKAINLELVSRQENSLHGKYAS